MIIRPAKIRRYPDPFIAPVHGTRGPCALCQTYSALTEDHVPPAGVGNTDHWSAQSYLISSSANQDLYFGRNFKGGLRFRTLCAECNNGLGESEDKAIIDFYASARKSIETPLILGPITKIQARPNLIFRGLMAHMVAANDSGVPSNFDRDVRDMFFKRTLLTLGGWNLFYWVYTGENLFLMRHAYHTTWHPEVKVVPIVVLKFYPLAFLFTQERWFLGLPNMRSFLTKHDEDEVELPLQLHRTESHPAWPVIPMGLKSIILLAGNSFGLVGRRW